MFLASIDHTWDGVSVHDQMTCNEATGIDGMLLDWSLWYVYVMVS